MEGSSSYCISRLLVHRVQTDEDALLAMGSNEGYNDPIVPNTFSWYSPLCFEALSLHLKSGVEKILKTSIEPTYSYGRIYTEGSELVRHTDRRSSELAVNLSIARDIKWDLNFLWEGSNSFY